MTALTDSVVVVDRFARSANLERDSAQTMALEGYALTGRAVDVVARIAGAGASNRGGRGR